MLVRMLMTTMNRSYSETMTFETFEERFKYLKLEGRVGKETFGHDRYLNQILYKDKEWRRTRRDIIIRDDGCDLGIQGRQIHGNVYVHHIDPITIEDVLNRAPKVFDPENLICTSLLTHNAIHYSDESILPLDPVERRPNDTCPWKKQ